MSAATPAPLPMYQEGLAYWEELTQHCRRHVEAINAAVSECGVRGDCLVQWIPGRAIRMNRQQFPSTEIQINIDFERWGPCIRGTIHGHQEEDLRFYPEEFEFLLSRDLDEGVVAICEEGRSMSPREFAKYLAQNFRRCYPGVSLPCPECDWN
jgi:hypothetical protein